jgi:hypothetical protein
MDVMVAGYNERDVEKIKRCYAWIYAKWV